MDGNRHERIEELKSRAALYRLFGALLYREVDEGWLEAFRNGPMQEWIAQGCEFDEDMNLPTHELKQELDAEFTSLWVAPGGVPRFQSIFETGMVFQSPCDQVNEVYRSEGFIFDMDEEKSFPDHAGVELEFLGHLLERQAAALEDGRDEEAARLGQVFRDFLVRHPGTWVPAMLNYSIMAAQHSFYREVCRMALAFLISEFESELPRREREKLLALLEREPKKLEYDADFRKSSGL